MRTFPKIFAATFLLGALVFFAAPQHTLAASCACYDPSTGKATGPTFDAPDGFCSHTGCFATCARDCALCAPDGGVDCGGAGGSTPAGSGNFSIESLFTNIGLGLNRIIIFLFLLATLLFLMGTLQYITAGGDEDKLKNARSLIIYGIIGLAVMVTVWAFVTIVIDFFFNSGAEISVPGPNIVRPL